MTVRRAAIIRYTVIFLVAWGLGWGLAALGWLPVLKR